MDRVFLHETLLRKNISDLADKLVTMVGVGALGSWASLFLADSGVKSFRLIDKDKVEDHNLSTQFYGKWNLGQSKVQALATELYRRHGCRVERHPLFLSASNAVALLQHSDLVVCTFDNKQSREIVQKTCLTLKVPCVMAGMHGTEYYGQIGWAENFVVPDDPEGVDVDPCNYALGLSLATWLSSLITEAALRFLLDGKKLTLRKSMVESYESKPV